MQYADDHNPRRLAHEVCRIGKTADQRAAKLSVNIRKLCRMSLDTLEDDIDLLEEFAAKARSLTFVPAPRFFEVIRCLGTEDKRHDLRAASRALTSAQGLAPSGSAS